MLLTERQASDRRGAILLLPQLVRGVSAMRIAQHDLAKVRRRAHFLRQMTPSSMVMHSLSGPDPGGSGDGEVSVLPAWLELAAGWMMVAANVTGAGGGGDPSRPGMEAGAG